MRSAAGWIVVAVLGGAGCWFFGLDILPSIVVALVVVALGFTVRVVRGAAVDREWPPAPLIPADGARRETTNLSWAMRTRSGFVDDRVIERVRDVAVGALQRRHLDLDNSAHRARIEFLLGAQSYALLTFAGRRRVRVSALLSTLAAIEQLEHRD